MHLQTVIQKQVLPAYPGLAGAAVSPLGNGLINKTFLLEVGDARFVLQRMAAIFPPAINDNIAAVTAALAKAGLVTPRLLPTHAGSCYLDLGETGGIWRLMTHVHGVSFDKVARPGQVAAAGELVARFHRALDGVDHQFVGLREGVHDTTKHLSRLLEALAAHPKHRLRQKVVPLAEAIFARARVLPALPALPPRICHGDLKLNNILFAGKTPPASEQAICLIDLDTVGPMMLAHELGDAWRSWCNPAGEDAARVHVDLEIFRASFAGYAGAIGRQLAKAERDALLLAPEWISLELSARFAADALNESYFGWNARRYASRGDHNLVRSQGQFALHNAFGAVRTERATILGL